MPMAIWVASHVFVASAAILGVTVWTLWGKS